MNIVGNVMQSLQQRSQEILAELRQIRGNISITLFVNPINRNVIDDISPLLVNPQFIKDRNEFEKPNDIDVIVDSFGGDADAAYHLAKLIDSHFNGNITYIIPRFAKSAATLLACGGNKIIMGETSELGPLDPQIRQNDGDYISAKSVKATLDLIKKQLKDSKHGLEVASILASRINPLVLGEYESTLKIAEEYQKELLSMRMFKGKSKNTISKVTKQFAKGYSHHSRVIGAHEAQKILGSDNVEIIKSISKEWQLLWELYINQKSMAELQGMMSALQNK